MATAYLETTTPTYLASRPSRDLVAAEFFLEAPEGDS